MDILVNASTSTAPNNMSVDLDAKPAQLSVLVDRNNSLPKLADERRKLLDNVVEEGELQTSEPPSPELEKP